MILLTILLSVGGYVGSEQAGAKAAPVKTTDLEMTETPTSGDFFFDNPPPAPEQDTIEAAAANMNAAADSVRAIADAKVAQMWEAFFKDRQGAIYTIRGKDENAVTTTGQLWFTADHRNDKTVTYREERSLVRIDCQAETVKYLTTLRYNAAGSVVMNEEYPEYAKPSHVAPDTLGDGILNYACKGRWH